MTPTNSMQVEQDEILYEAEFDMYHPVNQKEMCGNHLFWDDYLFYCRWLVVIAIGMAHINSL